MNMMSGQRKKLENKLLFFFFIRGNLISRKVYFMSPGKGVKLQLSQALIIKLKAFSIINIELVSGFFVFFFIERD